MPCRLALLVATSLALLADGLLGKRWPELVATRLHVVGPGRAEGATPPRSSAGPAVAVVAPGYGMSAEVLARAFGPHLQAGQVLIVVDYGNRQVDPSSAAALVDAELAWLRPATVRFYGASMGGLVAAELADMYAAAGSAFGPAVLVLDCAVSGPDTARSPALAFALARHWRGGPLSSAVARVVASIGTSVTAQPPAEEGADAGLIDAARKAERGLSMAIRMGQADFIGSHAVGSAARSTTGGHAGRTTYLSGAHAERDPSVDVPAARLAWARAYPGMVEREVAGRDGAWHIPLIERPRESLAALWAG